MKVAVLDLLSDCPTDAPLHRLYGFYFRKQFTSVMPQVVSVWCRQLGHSVTYATYYGQRDPEKLVPADVDVLFLSCYTQASALAYALAELFRRHGAITVIGGPHARSFPTDCLRVFDFVVRNCSRDTIDDLLRGHIDPPAIVDSGKPLIDFPSVEERSEEIEAAAFHRGRPLLTSLVPILSSVGCPYSCHFCVDWNSRYVALPTERLHADLEYVARRWPGVLVGYHDPNFAVRFDETMDVIESLPPQARPGYIMESSLSILRPERLPRLQATNCVYVAPGIESWTDYSKKSAAGARQGRAKLEGVVAHLQKIGEFVPGIQANFLFGSDDDRGDEPVDLTIDFIRALPEVWPTINIPTPFGGTPLYDRWYHERRILARLPFAFYYNPWLAVTIANYHPIEYYDRLIALHEELAGPRMLLRRLALHVRPAVRFVHALRTGDSRRELAAFRRIRQRLLDDRQFRAFHEGRGVPLPRFYRAAYRQRLGRYAELVRKSLMFPVLEPPADPGTAGSSTNGGHQDAVTDQRQQEVLS
jgi:radical SAM superfamily enzyme YgiQ (UPF0313 family)